MKENGERDGKRRVGARLDDVGESEWGKVEESEFTASVDRLRVIS